MKYFIGFLLTQLWRFLRFFPNSDPIMGFVIPASKNTEYWKAPLFAFASMFVFDFFTSGIGIWTWVTSVTYALIALGFRVAMKNKKAGIKLYTSYGLIGVLVFDFITGPLMSSVLFKQSFLVTAFLQVPFTLMHLISAVFGIIILAPLLDECVAKEYSVMKSTFENTLKNLRLQI